MKFAPEASRPTCCWKAWDKNGAQTNKFQKYIIVVEGIHRLNVKNAWERFKCGVLGISKHFLYMFTVLHSMQNVFCLMTIEKIWLKNANTWHIWSPCKSSMSSAMFCLIWVSVQMPVARLTLLRKQSKLFQQREIPNSAKVYKTMLLVFRWILNVTLQAPYLWGEKTHVYSLKMKINHFSSMTCQNRGPVVCH